MQKKQQPRGVSRNQIYDLLPMSTQGICDATGLSQTTVKKALAKLREDKKSYIGSWYRKMRSTGNAPTHYPGPGEDVPNPGAEARPHVKLADQVVQSAVKTQPSSVFNLGQCDDFKLRSKYKLPESTYN